MENPSCIHRLNIVIWNYSLKYNLKNQLVVLCLIYNKRFDSVVTINDSNWYKKRLNYRDREKNALFL
jgi:hypothetical protein